MKTLLLLILSFPILQFEPQIDVWFSPVNYNGLSSTYCAGYNSIWELQDNQGNAVEDTRFIHVIFYEANREDVTSYYECLEYQYHIKELNVCGDLSSFKVNRCYMVP